MISTARMPSPRRLVRRYTRYPVRWPMSYGNGEFIASGTILDVTKEGWKLVGRRAVAPGMRLHIRAFPPGQARPLWIEATVRWTNGEIFGIDVNHAPPQDLAWLLEYLNEALSLWLLPARDSASVPARRHSA